MSNSAVFLQNKDKSDDLVKVTKADAERIASKIELSNNIFCSEGGDLYRVATLVERNFTDEVAVNV